MCTRPERRHAGLSLVEVIVFMLIVAIAVSAMMLYFVRTAPQSTLAVRERQALAIAEGVLEEVRAMAWPAANLPCAAAAPNPRSIAVPPAAVPDLCRYNNFALADARLDFCRQLPAPCPAVPPAFDDLASFRTAVQVVAMGTAMPGIPANERALIRVVVTHPAGVSVSVQGIRARQAPRY